jgi:hypothetical protein
MSAMSNMLSHRIYAVVRHIPHGRVATYGQVALVVGPPGTAQPGLQACGRHQQQTGERGVGGVGEECAAPGGGVGGRRKRRGEAFSHGAGKFAFEDR